MPSLTPLHTEALGLIRYEILKHLDAADFLVSRNDAFESDEDFNSIANLVDDLIRVIKEVLDLHREDDDPEKYLSVLETIYRMMNDPKRMFGKLQERFRFY
jgi:hypothetical protein